MLKYYAESYRALTLEEQRELESYGCSCTDWSMVRVGEGFSPDRCRNVQFSGEVYLAGFDNYVELAGGIRKPTGIYHAHIHQCSIGKNVLIERVAEYIGGYNVGDNSIIINVDRIFISQETSFGNGTRVAIMNEAGGREIAISDILSAQVAYLMAFYRHDPELIRRLEDMTLRLTEQRRGTIGEIGSSVLIRGTRTIENVFVGDATRIEGASALVEGSIMSTHDAPVRIGHNVSCQEFILLSGSEVLDGATLSGCLVGQGSRLSHLFSAHDSLFFANCQGENGEACAVFAGPYTVTMHKSSLLIAGYYSFLNAGSGSNQSNHLYKLGPIHHGIVERGSKTTSDSYVLWPSHIGPFTLVMGRHVDHVDSSDFPFSYLIEDHNESYLVPGVNLRSVGTIRDAKKWPARDRRQGANKLDNINFNLLSPYTVGKMLRGYRALSELTQVLGNTGDQKLTYRNMRIRQRALDRGLRLYSMAITKFLGNSVIHRLKDCACSSDIELRECLRPESNRGLGRWIDLCGLLTPRGEVERIIESVKSGAIDNLEELNQHLNRLHGEYYELEWPWAYQAMLDWFGLEQERITREDILKIVSVWEESVIGLDEMLYEDARKEFAKSVRVGFGLEVCLEDKEADFESVRGDFDTNPFVLSVLEHIKVKRALGEDIRARLIQ